VKLGEIDILAVPVQKGTTKQDLVKALGIPIVVSAAYWQYQNQTIYFGFDDKVSYIN